MDQNEDKIQNDLITFYHKVKTHNAKGKGMNQDELRRFATELVGIVGVKRFQRDVEAFKAVLAIDGEVCGTYEDDNVRVTMFKMKN